MRARRAERRGSGLHSNSGHFVKYPHHVAGAISIFFDLFALQHLHSELRVHAGVVTGCMDGDLFFNGFRSTQFDVDHPMLHLIDFNGNCSGEEPVL